MKHHLAIVIPYYKMEFFEATLQSVAMQTDQRFALYIGNDASMDDPLPLIQKYFPSGSYNYYDYRDNLGGKNLALQWERILKNVKEDWFQILGDDDLVSENFVEEFHRNLEKAKEVKSNVIKVSQQWIDEEGKILNEPTTFPETFSAVYNWERKFEKGERASLSEHIFRREEWDRVRFRSFTLAWGSDDAAVFEVSNEQPIFFIGSALVKVRLSTANISGRTDNNQMKWLGDYEFQSYMIKNHFMRLPEKSLPLMIKNNLAFAYKNKLMPSLPLVRIHLYRKDFRSIAKLPALYFYLIRQKLYGN